MIQMVMGSMVEFYNDDSPKFAGQGKGMFVFNDDDTENEENPQGSDKRAPDSEQGESVPDAAGNPGGGAGGNVSGDGGGASRGGGSTGDAGGASYGGGTGN